MEQTLYRRWMPVLLAWLACLLLQCSNADARLGLGNNNVERQHLVFFSDDMDAASVEEKAADIARQTGGKVLWLYQNAIKGVALTGVSQTALSAFLSRVGVTSMEQDVWTRLEPNVNEVSPDDFELKHLPSNRQLNKVQEEFVPTGLDRIDQVSLPLDGQYSHRLDGSGVSVFVLDSGLRTTHVEFKERNVFCGYDAFETNTTTSSNPKVPIERCFDALGHGTHVAGTVGGIASGVAKNATLISVRVLDSDGYGSMASILAGIDYVVGQKMLNPKTPMVVNMSLGGLFSRTLNKALAKLVDAGVVLVVAAGNRRVSACLSSPGSFKRAITVGASTYIKAFGRDRRASYSNHGRCVDIFAPGSKITSASATSDTAFRSLSGTSMASPHVAGAVALYLQRDPTMTPEQVRTALLKDASQGKLMWLFNRLSPNKLLFTGSI